MTQDDKKTPQTGKDTSEKKEWDVPVFSCLNSAHTAGKPSITLPESSGVSSTVGS